MRRIFYCLIFLGMLSIPFRVNAQINITNYAVNTNAEVANAMVDSLVGDGVTFSNASFTGVRNSSDGFQIGYYQNSGITETEMGMTRGVTLTSGDIDNIPLTLTEDPGASNSFATGYSSSIPGEIRKSTESINDMDVLAGAASWYNGAILEFDFVPEGDSIVFKYVFGGEEYSDNTNFTNYQCSPYNDKFGFLISGPGVNGGAGYDNDARNIARLSNGSEVGINSVNDGVVGSSGSPNGPSYCSNENTDWVEGTPSPEFGGTIQGTKPNGNTIVLNATQGGLTPGQNYHIRLLIADVSDATYDAVVYIESGSFSSPPTGLTLEANPQSICLGESTYVVANTAELVPPITYEWSDGTVNTTSNAADSILVAPTVNTTYSVTVTDSDAGTAFVGNESLEITVNNPPTVNLGTDQSLCSYNVPITLDAGAAMSDYNWSEGSDTQTLDVSSSDTYAVTVTDGNGCTANSSMTLTVNTAPTVDLGTDQTLCSYDVPITLDAGAAMSDYNWSDGSDTQTSD
ncbi:MAG: choice-of-anchor L domain-containing protein, partial [Bacteroidales bacterium]|nr:choice-of-anchor L domain-containing protein [Bacteroidales bacterium]